MAKVSFRQDSEIEVYHDAGDTMLNAVYRDDHGIIYAEFGNMATLTFMSVDEFAEVVSILSKCLQGMVSDEGEQVSAAN